MQILKVFFNLQSLIDSLDWGWERLVGRLWQVGEAVLICHLRLGPYPCLYMNMEIYFFIWLRG